MKPPYKIGDIIPLAPGETINRAALGYAKARKTRNATMLARSEGVAAKNQHVAGARKADELNRDRERRMVDPFEQAKAFLQRKGYVVYSAKLCSPPRKGIVAGRKLLADEKAVIAYAAMLGWIHYGELTLHRM